MKKNTIAISTECPNIIALFIITTSFEIVVDLIWKALQCISFNLKEDIKCPVVNVILRMSAVVYACKKDVKCAAMPSNLKL